MKKYNAILFRGLWGSIFSKGMDVQAEMLRKHPKIDYVLVLSWREAQRATNLIKQFKDDNLLFGHSFGVGACLQVTENVPEKEFLLVISYDPSQYWSRGHTLTKNIKKCINFWQDAPFWFIGNQNIKGAENIHVDTTHVAIEDRRDLHLKVLDEISKLP